jgi:phosphoglycerate dehydrogenase-like enzyme
MTFKVINTNYYFSDAGAKFLEQNDCEFSNVPTKPMSEDEICELVRDKDAIISAGEPWTEKTFQAAGNMKIIARTGAGTDTIDKEAATRHGVWVTNTPDATTDAVADYTLGVILALLRDLPGRIQDVRSGKWELETGRELGAMTLGILGLGSIGRAVVRRARAFGAKSIACDITQDKEFAAEHDVEYVPLDELMSGSDIISIHVNLSEKTEGLLSREMLGLMKKTAYLVNTSRSQVVDKDALVEKLSSGQIAGAALDVHFPAPCSPDDPLVVLDNVIPTPWIAYQTQDAIEKMVDLAVRDVVAVLKGGTPKHPVNSLPEKAQPVG